MKPQITNVPSAAVDSSNGLDLSKEYVLLEGFGSDKQC